MKISEILEIVHGDKLTPCNDDFEIQYAFASDLMSDALAMIHDHCESTILVTGLCNAQSIRTADMLDIRTILIVRGKKYNEQEIELAKSCGIDVITTSYTMFETCGLLYKKGLKYV